jgi:hypothetical protein
VVTVPVGEDTQEAQ